MAKRIVPSLFSLWINSITMFFNLQAIGLLMIGIWRNFMRIMSHWKKWIGWALAIITIHCILPAICAQTSLCIPEWLKWGLVIGFAGGLLFYQLLSVRPSSFLKDREYFKTKRKYVFSILICYLVTVWLLYRIAVCKLAIVDRVSIFAQWGAYVIACGVTVKELVVALLVFFVLQSYGFLFVLDRPCTIKESMRSWLMGFKFVFCNLPGFWLIFIAILSISSAIRFILLVSHVPCPCMFSNLIMLPIALSIQSAVYTKCVHEQLELLNISVW